jgi:hypothetical protein
VQSITGEGPLTDEEEFMNQVTKSTKKHARAKLLIMQFIGLILEGDNSKNKIKDFDPK